MGLYEGEILEEASITEEMSDLRLFYCILRLHGDARVKVIGSRKHI